MAVDVQLEDIATKTNALLNRPSGGFFVLVSIIGSYYSS